MESAFTACIVLAALLGAVWIGNRIRRLLPEHHLSQDTRDAVKLAVGMVATMSALLLGLLISSAKGSYDQLQSEVIQISAKIALLDRVLEIYGPETAEPRGQLHAVVTEMIRGIWSNETGITGQGIPKNPAAVQLYGTVHNLVPRNETQRSLKEQAGSLMEAIAQLRWLLQAQSVSSISKPLLAAVIFWLVVVFLGFSILTPRNATGSLALLISAFSVAGAVFLITELDHPFSGLIQISSEPMLNAVKHFTS